MKHKTITLYKREDMSGGIYYAVDEMDPISRALLNHIHDWKFVFVIDMEPLEIVAAAHGWKVSIINQIPV